MDSGVTIYPHYDGESYGAEIYVYSDSQINEREKVDEFIFKTIEGEFETKRIEGFPKEIKNADGSFNRMGFGYEIKIDEEDWFFKDDPRPSDFVDYGFFSARVSVNYSNPFSLFFREGTRFSRIYKLLTEGAVDFPWSVFDVLGMGNVSGIDATVLMNGTYTLMVETGEIMFDSDYNSHYYKLSTKFTKIETEVRIVYSYTVIQSYAWFIVAIVLGLTAVGLTLLFAKKMSGRVVDAKRKKAAAPSAEFIFDPFVGSGRGGGPSGGGSSGSDGVFEGV